MQAIILAAGMGKRLKGLTKDCTKCMVKVNGVTLIDRMLHQIEALHVSRIVIVIGYQGDKLVDYIDSLGIETPIIYIRNEIYDRTNNIYSLALASEYLTKESTLLFESDLIFEDEVINLLVDDSRETLALVDKYESWMDGTCVKLNDEDHITAFINKSAFRFEEIKEYYKTVNIYKFSQEFSQNYYVPFLSAYAKALGNNEYYEQVLRVITMLDVPIIQAKRLDGQRWYEIDDIQDLDIASSIFPKDTNREVDLLQKRGGGYWRYPRLLDFIGCGNPYFPSQRLLDEIKANFENIALQAPSSMDIHVLLAKKNWDIRQENILVLSDVNRCIRSLIENVKGKVGLIHLMPDSFVKSNEQMVVLDNESVHHTASDYIKVCQDKEVEGLLVANPDPVTGEYIPRKEMGELVQWAHEERVPLIYDETMADFFDEADSSFLQQQILDKYPEIYIIKHLSLSHGIPGLRIFIVASGNIPAMQKFKSDMGKDGLDSFAEFYMQIFEKYKKEYVESTVLLKDERRRLESELANLEGVSVIPSQGNYVLVNLDKQCLIEKVMKEMLFRYNILLANVDGTLGAKGCMKIAIRTRDDNDYLLSSLKETLKNGAM